MSIPFLILLIGYASFNIYKLHSNFMYYPITSGDVDYLQAMGYKKVYILPENNHCDLSGDYDALFEDKDEILLSDVILVFMATYGENRGRTSLNISRSENLEANTKSYTFHQKYCSNFWLTECGGRTLNFDWDIKERLIPERSITCTETP